MWEFPRKLFEIFDFRNASPLRTIKEGAAIADRAPEGGPSSLPQGTGPGALKDVALGLTHHGTPSQRMMEAGIPPSTILWEREAIEVFGKKRNAASYRHWMREGLSQADPRFEFQRAFAEAIANAKDVHFNLDGMDLQQAWRRGQNPDPYAAGITNWEFVQVLKDGDLRGKTTFWQNGKQVPRSRVFARAGATLPP